MASGTFEADVICVPMSSPATCQQVVALFDSKKVDPKHVVAIMEQTEGDAYARGYATWRWKCCFRSGSEFRASRYSTPFP